MNTMLKSLGCLATGNTPSKKVIRYWSSNDIPFIKPAALKENSIEMLSCESDFISHEAEDNARIAKKDAVLVTCIGIIGKVGIVANENVAFNQQLTSITPNQSLVYPRYLAWNLVANKKRLQSISNAPVVPIINKTQLSEFEIKVEQDLDTQRKISQVLDRIEHQLNLHFHKLEILDNLVKSRFVEMFGDLLKNSKGQTLGDISELITVGIANAATHAYADKGTIMLRNLNIRENRLDDTDLISIRPEFAAKYKKKALKSGDILVTRTGYPGVACIVPEKYAGCQTFTTLIVRLDASSGASATFVSQYINSPLGKEYVNKMKAGSSQQNFGATSLKSMPIVVPPFALQQEFADFVSQVDKLRFATKQQIDKLETLKNSLMQEYFG